MENVRMAAVNNALNARSKDLANAKSEGQVQDIVNEITEEARELSRIPDTKVYQIAVSFLGVIVVIAILAQAYLVYQSNEIKIPEGLVAIGSMAIGALAGMLTPTSSS